jgi:hypothetical protein
MAPIELYYALQRDVTFGDFATLIDLLNSRGHTATPLQRDDGGICFRFNGEDVGRSLQFEHADGALVQKIPQTDGVFTADPAAIFATYTAPEWSEENMLQVNLFNGVLEKKFSVDDIADIRKDIATALGVAENTILTDDREIEDGDSPELVRRYLHYNLEEAVARWTIPDPRCPDVKTGGIFKCWKCNKRKPSHNFPNGLNKDGSTSFYSLLATYEKRYEIPWCNHCAWRQSTLKWTESASKRLRTL